MIVIGNLVKYHSDINKIPLRNFNEKELNLFFSLLFKAKEKGTNKIEISFIDLRKISNGDTHSNRFLNSLKNLVKKLLAINLEQVLDNDKIAIFNIFNEFIIDSKNKKLEIQVHERFYYMLNDFLTYTQFELEQLVGLRSSYSKNIFRLLKQFETTKILNIYMDEFKRILCIPESYKMSEIDRTVIKPAILELKLIFPNLKLEKIKDGRRIKTLKFTWSKNKELLSEDNLVNKEVKISKNLSDYIEILKRKNRYIAPYLTPANIEIFLKEWSDEILIKGLKFAKDQIQKEFKSLNYLKKVIETGIEASEKFFAIEEDTKEEKIEKKNEEKPIVSKLKVDENPLIEIKGEIAKWCMKNKKYSLFEELENIETLISLGKFIGKYGIDI